MQPAHFGDAALLIAVLIVAAIIQLPIIIPNAKNSIALESVIASVFAGCCAGNLGVSVNTIR